MNKIIIFGAGLAAGSILGVIGGIFYQKRKDKEALDETAKSYHEVYEQQRKTLEEYRAHIENTEVSTLDNPNILDKFISKEDEEKLKEAFGKNYAYNYNAHSNGVAADPLMPTTDKSSIKEPEPRDEAESLHPLDSDEDFLTEDEETYLNGYLESENREIERQTPPRIIKDEEYGTDGRYAEASLFYYPDQDILCDENNEQIANPEMIIGKTFDKFDFRNNTQDHMCIRNFVVGLDYWIIKKEFPYVPDKD